jgi:hypothetical protein
MDRHARPAQVIESNAAESKLEALKIVPDRQVPEEPAEPVMTGSQARLRKAT